MEKNIIAEYAPGIEDEKRDGTDRMICPVCGKVVLQRQIECYEEEGADRSVEVCIDCREDFEFDSELRLEADVLDTVVFMTLWEWVIESLSPVVPNGASKSN